MTRRLHCIALCTYSFCCAFGVLDPQLARAEQEASGNEPAVPSAAPAPEPVAHGSEWYGWQTLAVDGGALVLGAIVAASADVEVEPLHLIAATWFGAGAVFAPAVHYAHDAAPLGAASFGMRIFVPPVFGFFGWITACTANEEFESGCAAKGWGVGSLIGLSGTALLDGLLFAREREELATGPRGYWYGWQMLALEAIGYALGAAFAASNPRNDEGEEIHPVVGTWAIGYTVGVISAPIVHFTHGRVGLGFASLGLRLIGPAIVGVLPGLWGYCAATGGADDCAEHGALWGLLGGSLAVSLFDALVLAHEPAAERATASSAPAIWVGPGTIGVRAGF